MTNSTLTSNIHQSLDVSLNLRAQCTFNFNFIHRCTNSCQLIIVPILNFDVFVNTSISSKLILLCFFRYHRCKSIRLHLSCFLVNQYLKYVPYFNLLSLSLFEFRILLINHVNSTFSLYNLAIYRSLLY